jgi:hypothetical protein
VCLGTLPQLGESGSVKGLTEVSAPASDYPTQIPPIAIIDLHPLPHPTAQSRSHPIAVIDLFIFCVMHYDLKSVIPSLPPLHCFRPLHGTTLEFITSPAHEVFSLSRRCHRLYYLTVYHRLAMIDQIFKFISRTRSNHAEKEAVELVCHAIQKCCANVKQALGHE